MTFKKGEQGNPNHIPRGRGRRGAALSERINDLVDYDEMFQLAMAQARGEPMVRLLDRATGRPRLAERPHRGRMVSTADSAPISMVAIGPEDVIADVSWPTFADRMVALSWIAKFGDMTPATEINGTQVHVGIMAEVDFSKFSPEELDAYIELTDKLVQKELPAGEVLAPAREKE